MTTDGTRRTEQAGRATVWEHLDELSDAQLRHLSEAAISVLWEQTPDPVVQSPALLPPTVLTSQLGEALQDHSLAERMTSDERLLRTAGLAVLAQLAAEPALAAEIDAAYRARQELMIVDGGVLIGGALLLAVFKLKRIKIGKDGVEVNFYQAKADVLTAIRRIVGG